MKPRDRTRQLREIVEVRAVQLQAAELKVAQANQALARLHAREARQQEALRQDQAQWQAALGAPSLSLPMMQTWSSQILRGATGLVQTAGEITGAESEKAARSQAWHQASALSDAADQLAASAQAADRRRLEEARLNDIADRFAHRVTPW